ncbi:MULTISPECIES: quinohemoprotein amine dehydrogenase subunit beta [Marinobacterium]|jgi:quinohemoprotein amine dehydrogenase beta subunit|uniref:Quinohemoprotein amine dehydrogenase, beta subunit n=1 Tax=Marinobacterium iners DSM 11526 TaxID=1122198 RepID=A0A1H4EI79_9GAMM|nr:quinohemoprotein amine dehydrogenase subunit beta [Marinobacterium iners]QSR35840.1 quinohemoprotein amine dehydrogenase subunit beta [Marinobacterium iners]SEA84791.1 quinohemoprotein amine dehydrogenase, beta subunit [Marinobacterium iners DSM 11526]
MKISKLFKSTALAGSLGTAALLSAVAPAAAAAQEYLLTVTRPGHLHVIDMKTNKVERTCDIPGNFGSGSIAPSPDGKIAYVLSNGMEDVYGFDIRTCEITFHAAQSTPTLKVKSFQSLAVSADGKEVYTVQNPFGLKRDRFTVEQPRLAVFNVADGVGAKPVRTFPVERRITKIAATAKGEVILGGADVKAIDPKTGDIRMVTPLQNWEKGPLWLPPDAFAMHSQGEQSNEYIMPYSTAKFDSEEWNFETAEWWWGMSRVNLETGEATRQEIFPFEFIIFNFISDPRDPNILYGSFNTLSKHDLRTGETLALHEMEHTYYNLNISADGKTIYVGGTANDISIHDSETLDKIGSIELSGDMTTSDLRVATIRD